MHLQPECVGPQTVQVPAKEYTLSSCRPCPRRHEATRDGESVKKMGNVARVRNATERRALEQAKRVPWPRLAKAADEYTDWHSFALWVRATVDTSNNVPPLVQSEIERCAPRSFSALRSKVEAAINRRARPGVVAWEEVICWAEMNVFLAAKRGGWLDALRYFSAMSLRSIQAWAHWEREDADWRLSPPGKLPTFREWEGLVSSVTRLSNAECAAQRTLDAMRTMRKSDWDKLLAVFTHLNAFCQWMELMLDAQKTMSEQLSQELLSRYPGFSLVGRRKACKDAARHLTTWVLSHDIPGAKATGVLAALRFCLRHHPEYGAVRNYARFCRRAWVDDSQHFPTFDEWKQAVDRYSEAD